MYVPLCTTSVDNDFVQNGFANFLSTAFEVMTIKQYRENISDNKRLAEAHDTHH